MGGRAHWIWEGRITCAARAKPAPRGLSDAPAPPPRRRLVALCASPPPPLSPRSPSPSPSHVRPQQPAAPCHFLASRQHVQPELIILRPLGTSTRPPAWAAAAAAARSLCCSRRLLLRTASSCRRRCATAASCRRRRCTTTPSSRRSSAAADGFFLLRPPSAARAIRAHHSARAHLLLPRARAGPHPLCLPPQPVRYSRMPARGGRQDSDEDLQEEKSAHSSG